MNQIKKKTIYTFNAAGFLLYPVAKAYFSLDDKDVYKMIEDGFSILQKQLSLKGISYNELKGALIPNQDKKRAEKSLPWCEVMTLCHFGDSILFRTFQEGIGQTRNQRTGNNGNQVSQHRGNRPRDQQNKQTTVRCHQFRPDRH